MTVWSGHGISGILIIYWGPHPGTVRLNCLTNTDPNLLPFTTLYWVMELWVMSHVSDASDVSNAVWTSTSRLVTVCHHFLVPVSGVVATPLHRYRWNTKMLSSVWDAVTYHTLWGYLQCGQWTSSIITWLLVQATGCVVYVKSRHQLSRHLSWQLTAAVSLGKIADSMDTHWR